MFFSLSEAFESFQLKGSDDQCSSFALRSRIKTRAASTSPLASLRIVVKDNIHLRGVKTSIGNRAFYDTYPPQQESAECIQILMDQGVVVVGKAKMDPLGIWEEPQEYVDYQAPWNPRADHYQSPGGSNSGSAAAIASYNWLDIAIGTDSESTVPIPRPYQCETKIFGRSVGKYHQTCTLVWVLWSSPNHRRSLLEWSRTVLPVRDHEASYWRTTDQFRRFDTPGILARDLRKCRAFAAEWLSPDKLVKHLSVC